MKVGIMTFHHTYNFGASLQAFALQTYLEHLGHEAHILNYLNDKMHAEQQFSWIDKKKSKKYNLVKLFNAPTELKRRKKFDRFDKQFLHITEPRIHSAKELSVLSQAYDRVIVGSDQVMNLVGTGFDYNYYFDFEIPSYKKATYAPSFGLQNLDEAVKKKMSALLSDIPFLTTREGNGVDIIQSLTGRTVPLVCDPTFLLSKEDWEKYAIKPKIKRPYVVIYSFNSYPAIEEAAQKKAKEINGVVIDIHRFLPAFKKGYRIEKNISPLEMIGYLMNASYVFTNSFHGAALSFNFNKNVFVFSHPRKTSGNSFNPNFRLQSLVQMLGVEERLVEVGDVISQSDIDYEQLNKKLLHWRESSKKELNNCFSQKSK